MRLLNTIIYDHELDIKTYEVILTDGSKHVIKIGATLEQCLYAVAFYKDKDPYYSYRGEALLKRRISNGAVVDGINFKHVVSYKEIDSNTKTVSYVKKVYRKWFLLKEVEWEEL